MSAERTVAVSGRDLSVEAMGSTARVIVDGGPPELAAMLVDELHRLERMWSRFRADSEVSRLTDQLGQPFVVSAPTAELIDRAQAAHDATGGLFDPCLAGAVDEAGYRTYSGTTEMVRRDRVASISDAVVRIDASGPAVVQLPPGCQMDLGGIGKGYAADLLTARAIQLGASWALVDIGGDLRVRNGSVQPRETEVAIAAAPSYPATASRVILADGGVATSGVARRRWSGGHHLIDPRTRRPAATDVDRVTALAGETWWAEVCATAAVVLGATDGLAMLDDFGLPGRAVTDRGRVLTNAAWGRLERGIA